MEIKDLSWNEYLLDRHNHPLLPRSIKGLIVGKSGCGKTVVLMNLLLQPGWLDYDNLNVFGKSLFQSEYKIIKKAFEKKLSKEAISKLFEMREDIQRQKIDPIKLLDELTISQPPHSINCEFFDSASDVPDPSALSKSDKNLMIFDDLQLEKQNKCEDYYVRGRHSNVDCFYLAQNYFKLPRQTIRENTNFICLFPQDIKNIHHIYNDHVGDDMTKEEFRIFCRKCWSMEHGFVVIDLTSKKCYGKYRCGFDLFYIPKNI